MNEEAFLQTNECCPRIVSDFLPSHCTREGLNQGTMTRQLAVYLTSRVWSKLIEIGQKKKNMIKRVVLSISLVHCVDHLTSLLYKVRRKKV